MRKHLIFLAVVLGVFVLAAGTVFANTIERVNLDYLGNELTGFKQGDWPGWGSDISADGRYVVFNSYLPNIVPNDTNGKWDVFIRDLETGEVELVSVDNDGQQFQDHSLLPEVSADGRYVVFVNKQSVSWRGFNNFDNVYVRDRVAGTTKRVSVNVGQWGNGGYINPVISDDGKVVAYQAYRHHTSGRMAIVHDLESGTAKLAPFSTIGLIKLSGNGRYLALHIHVPNTYNINRVYVYDRITEQSHLASKHYDGTVSQAYYTRVDISYDGRYTVLQMPYRWGPQEGRWTYVAYDLETDTTSPIFLRDDGTPIEHRSMTAGVSISGNGKQIVLLGSDPALFPEGSGIFYYGKSFQLFVIDRESKEVLDLVSYGYNGEFANKYGEIRAMSDNGQYVLFESRSTNLVPDDTNNEKDAFLVDRGPQNASPVADAGDDQTVECAGLSGTAVVLDGVGSSDPDSDTLTYTWSGPFGTADGVTATVTLPLGTHTITLTVNDGNGETATDDVVISVQDTTPPVVSDASLSGTELLSGHYLSDVLFEMSATDICSGVANVRYILDGSQNIISGSYASATISTGGDHTIVYDAVDHAGNVSAADSLSFTLFEANPVGLTELIDYFLAQGLIAPQMETSLKQQASSGAYGAFINHVGAQSGKKIDTTAAQALIQAASYIMGN